MPDGSGVVYSAVIVNGKGDRELYRVPRTGGNPVTLTNTPHNEFLQPSLPTAGRSLTSPIT